jgi:short-subunit dehydrogenase
MLKRASGSVINVASLAGTAPLPGGLTYGASKAAVIAATETARVEFRNTGVRFTCVLPSFTNTDLISGTTGVGLIPTVEPDDVATAVLSAISRPRHMVYVPRTAGVMARIQPFLGRRLRDGALRRLGAYEAFDVADASLRADYDRRVARDAGRR